MGDDRGSMVIGAGCLIRQCITKAFIKIILRKAREMQSWRKGLESFLQIMTAGKSSA